MYTHSCIYMEQLTRMINLLCMPFFPHCHRSCIFREKRRGSKEERRRGKRASCTREWHSSALTLLMMIINLDGQLTSQRNRDHGPGWGVYLLARSLDPPHHTLWMRGNVCCMRIHLPYRIIAHSFKTMQWYKLCIMYVCWHCLLQRRQCQQIHFNWLSCTLELHTCVTWTEVNITFIVYIVLYYIAHNYYSNSLGHLGQHSPGGISMPNPPQSVTREQVSTYLKMGAIECKYNYTKLLSTAVGICLMHHTTMYIYILSY